MLQIEAELIYEFTSFTNWVNNASSRIGGFPGWEQIICIAKNGKACTGGEDMMYARDNDLFPVKAYRLIRTIEP